MHPRVLVLAAAIAVEPLTVNTAVAQGGRPLFPSVVDSTHATAKAVRFFDSFFTAKSRHDVDATMGHFSRVTLTYIDATLGWPWYSFEELKDLFAQYMPKWPPAGLSYPTRILGNERSAVVAFTDTPELFGREIRIVAAIDLEDGKVVRWIDYWDGRHFGAELAAKMRTPADKFPTDFKETSVRDNTSVKIRGVVTKLHAAMASNDAKSVAMLLSNDVIYEDLTLRTQVLGKLAENERQAIGDE